MKYHHKNLYCLSVMALAIASSFTPYGAHAQETDKKSKDSKRLKEVEVVGTSPLPGIGIEEDKLPYDVQSINAEALYRSQSMNLTDFMSRNLSGVNINEVQGSPFQADITYRGFRLSGILGSPQGLSVYLDGVRVNEPFGDVINWDMIPEAAINNVTLVPGSNPIYGLNTLGGALAFTTKSGLTAPGTEVKLQAAASVVCELTLLTVARAMMDITALFLRRVSGKMGGEITLVVSWAMYSRRLGGSRMIVSGICRYWWGGVVCWGTACYLATATAQMAPVLLQPVCTKLIAGGCIRTPIEPETNSIR
ncbi:MAG: TonB-dependent receptor plug domain-containing protein [Betaproteobacteria bacterium]